MDLEEEKTFQERVVAIKRCAKVVKGGRRFSFTSLVVLGNGQGKVGVGEGKAQDVTEAIRKGRERAQKNILDVKLVKNTISHEILSKFGATKILMRPASAGTGVIAGGAARAVLELAGVHNVLTKVFGSSNSCNVVKATLQGLLLQRSRAEVKALRE